MKTEQQIADALASLLIYAVALATAGMDEDDGIASRLIIAHAAIGALAWVLDNDSATNLRGKELPLAAKRDFEKLLADITASIDNAKVEIAQYGLEKPDAE